MAAERYTPADIGWPPPEGPGHRSIGDYRGPLPLPFAVICPIDPTPARLAEVAAVLDGLPWTETVIGIDQMRRGQRPHTPCDLLGVPCYPSNPFDPVAMVFVKGQDYTDERGKELTEALDGLAHVLSPELYSAVNR
jgi:hypothetical protein